jgi:membrane carboxypeptidase/penicillin-binding protein
MASRRPRATIPDHPARPIGSQPNPAAPAIIPAPRVLDERNVFIMTSVLQDVIREGTARHANETRSIRSRGEDGHAGRSACR